MTPESMAVYEEWQRPHCLGAKPGNYSWIIAEVSGAGTLTLHFWQPFDGLSACKCAAIQGIQETAGWQPALSPAVQPGSVPKHRLLMHPMGSVCHVLPQPLPLTQARLRRC